MVRKKGKTKTEQAVTDYRHEEAKRLHIPPAGLAAQGKIREKPKIQYSYNPHLPPILRFDRTGNADGLPELLEIARTRALTHEESQILAEALRVYEPWLEWAGKQEKKSFEVDPVALHIHERISAQAILKVLAREDVQRSLFADPQLEYHKAVQFYLHDVDWSNRMILGDSLQVMASLARREGLAGKVQMIYMDPPYGIKFSSNFQWSTTSRDVKDGKLEHSYFLGANDPYKSLKTTLKAEINEETWATLNSDTSRPFDKPKSGRIAVKVINHLGDEVMKVFRVEGELNQ